MGGGLINIVSYGLDDLYLTGAAQITFFKSAHRRHTNYSQESIDINIGQTNFNEEITIDFPKIGDLFGNAYLQINLPQVNLLKTDIATNLTIDETTFLQNSINLPASVQILQSIQQDYNIITTFMKTNMAGYRVAFRNLNIQNQNITDYITSITNVLVFTHTGSAGGSSTIESDYQNALNKALNYENSLGNYTDDITLNFITSDILDILTKILHDPNYTKKYTIKDIANRVFNATAISVKVKNYYFKKRKQFAEIIVDHSTTRAKFAWVPKIGHALIDHIDINIGGDRIDRHYYDYIEIWHQLTGFNNQDKLYDKMIGNVIELTTFDRQIKPAYTLTIPLYFWFCKKAGLYFPIVALQYSPISITIKFSSINKCAYVEQLPTTDNGGNPISIDQLSLDDIWDNVGYVMTANLLVDYIYLENTERKRFAQSAHEYLIETVQRMTVTDITEPYQNVLLEFGGPSKELIWYAHKTAYTFGDETKKKLLFNYSLHANNTGNPFISSELSLSGTMLFNTKITNYHTDVQSYSHHTRTPEEGVNLYSFCLYPEEHQPSATCNFSIIPNSIMTFVLDPDMFTYRASDINPNIIPNSLEDSTLPTTVTLVVLSKRYDILRIIGGMGGFAFKYMS